jgi:LDH2 family malate/lactate/ureidoglycolate dehydrogenase
MHDSGKLTIAVGDLTRFAADLMVAVGVPKSFAQLVAEGLVRADREEIESHGVMLLPMYIDRIVAGSVAPDRCGTVVSVEGGSVVIDAENGLGQVTSKAAVFHAVSRAREQGLGAVAVRNAFHYGTAGYWASEIAQEGCIGISMSNTRPLMPAPGGAQRVVGNNPIAIAVPGSPNPVVMDFATSATAMGKIRMAEARGESLPGGLATDSTGVPTTDPATAIKGMLLPAAGAKGFGLAVMIDFLCGGLSSGGVGEAVTPLYGDPSIPYNCSHFFLAIDVGSFCPSDAYRTTIDKFSRHLRGSPSIDPSASVMMPGDPAQHAADRNSETCRISAATIATLGKLAERLSVAAPSTVNFK